MKDELEKGKVYEAADFDIEIAGKRLERGTFASDEGVGFGEQYAKMVAERLTPKPKPEYGFPVEKLMKSISVTVPPQPPPEVTPRVYVDTGPEAPTPATYCEIHNVLDSVRIRTADFPMLRGISCRVGASGTWWTVMTEVDDRNYPGHRIPVHFGFNVAVEEQLAHPNLRTFILATLRRILRMMLEHELDECIYVDGERVFDPHVNDRPQRVPYYGDPATEAAIKGVLR